MLSVITDEIEDYEEQGRRFHEVKSRGKDTLPLQFDRLQDGSQGRLGEVLHVKV